ncbi:MAG: PEP-CTERM sorting domain-containing protein [Planctomycetota bacterium]
MTAHSRLLIAAVLAACLLQATSARAELLVGSFLLELNQTLGIDQQSFSDLATRTGNGNVETRGQVEGSVDVMAGQEVGTSSYTGAGIRNFSFVTQYNDLNRFGSEVNGGLVTFDFDFSSFLAGKNIGASLGQSAYSIELDYTGRRSSGGSTGQWFISYNGGGLTLDTTDITSHTVGGNASGVENGELVRNTSLYKPVLTLPAAVASGTASVDITSDIATIAAGDGAIRVAYFNGEFRGDTLIQNVSGIVETTVIPEPGSLVFVGIVFAAAGVRRRV